MEQLQQEISELKNKLSTLQSVTVILCVIWLCLSGLLGETVFSYEVKKEAREPYEHVVDEVWDYTCYTTNHGDCYHEQGCRYLHSSSNRTTVQEAKENGYRACSKCNPPIKLPVVITETRYRTVFKTEKKEPIFLVLLIGTGVIVGIYYVWQKFLTEKIDKKTLLLQQAELKEKAYERLLRVLEIGAGVGDVDQAILKVFFFYSGKGKKIPRELWPLPAPSSREEKYERLLKILEIGTGVTGIENVTNALIDFYKSKGITIPNE